MKRGVPEYDPALKILLKASADSVLKQITGLSVDRWLNVEMQDMNVSRVDLLGATPDGEILHIELQSTNDPAMAVRMAEYSLHIYRQFGKFPTQVVLYVGQPKLRMSANLGGPDPIDPDFTFRYKLIDFRQLDGDLLLASNRIEDNLLAILARLRDQKAAIRQIMRRITSLEDSTRAQRLPSF